MKLNKSIGWLILVFGFLFSCTPDPTDPGNDNTDTSPGVDEFFRVDIEGNHWEVNDDEVIGATLANFGSGPLYNFAATNQTDSSYFFYNIPYFYSNDTTWNLGSIPSNMALTFNTDSIYDDVSTGSLHIIRSNVGSMEVFTGTFNYTGHELLHNSPAVFTNGEFVIARLL